MTKKKRGHPDLEEVLARPWCYYCERDFDDDKVLMNHQKAKHFKCHCNRRLNTAGGLAVHLSQVHKETLTTIDNALPNRADLSVEIFGMEGIPDDVLQQHRQRVITQFHQEQADRRQATGNPAPGSGQGSAPKKVKVEAPMDLKKRLAEHKARKAAEAAGIMPTDGSESGGNTPLAAAVNVPGPGIVQSPDPYTQAGASQFNPMGQPQQFAAYGQPPFGMTGQVPPPFSPHPFNMASGPPAFFPPGQQMAGPPHFQQNTPSMPMPFPPPPQTYPGGSLSPVPFQNNRQAPPLTHASAVHTSFQVRPAGLPAAPGLPSRPSFGAPPVNALQMQQMHQGHIPPTHPVYVQQHIGVSLPEAAEKSAQEVSPTTANVTNEVPTMPAAIQSQAPLHDSEQVLQEQATAGAADGVEKKAKKTKDKEKAMRLIYADNEVSPEEKMAKKTRYAFDPATKKEPEYLGSAVEATTTGVVVG